MRQMAIGYLLVDGGIQQLVEYASRYQVLGITRVEAKEVAIHGRYC